MEYDLHNSVVVLRLQALEIHQKKGYKVLVVEKRKNGLKPKIFQTKLEF
jgi:hypothetical protein